MYDELEKTELIKQLKLNISDNQKQLDDLNYNLNAGMKRLSEHCDNLRNEIKYTTLSTIQKINQIGQNLVNQVNEYESQCVRSFYENNFKSSYDSLVDEANHFEMEWNGYLNQTNIDFDQLIHANQISSEIQKKVYLENNR